MSRITVRSVNHVGIPISDRSASMRFYRDTAGLTVIPHQVEGNTLAWTECMDQSMVHLIDPPAEDAADNRQHVAFEVEDLDEVMAALEEHGVEIESGPGTRRDGQRAIFVRDPDGNRIEICTRADHSRTTRSADENGYTSDG